MFQISGIIFWLIVIPFCIGLIPAGLVSNEKRNPGFVFLAGYLVMWALFGVVTIPVVVFVRYDNFILASNLFLALALACAAAGIFLAYRNKKKVCGSEIRPAAVLGRAGFAGRLRGMSWEERVEWLLFFILLGFQLYKAAAYASFDGDDAYYVAASLIAQQADTMYTILPLTGRHTGLDIRHAMAVFPMWIAFVADKSRIHATILSHSLMPFVLIPLTYLSYYEIGSRLFRQRAGTRRDGKSGEDIFCRENLPVFMILMAMFQIFGNVSIYTNETFFLTRTWQGKAVAGSLVIPAFLWLFLLLYDGAAREKRRTEAGVWLLLVCANITAGICSSIAVFLVSILMAVTGLCLAFVARDFKLLFKMGAACIPNAVYVLIYLVVGYSYLLQ